MAALLTARNLTTHYGARTLFRGVSISVGERERLALIGPNGAGKSTLIRILAGLIAADEGDISARRGLRLAYVAQADEFPPDATIRSAVIDELEQARQAGALPRIHDAHELELAAEMALERSGFTALDRTCALLSGGQRRRLSIVRALARQPDLLLLDEPTNHLDVEGIQWLEESLTRHDLASIIITHDRAFLERTATRIVELSTAYPEGTFSVLGGYTEFLRRKTEFLEGQARQQQALSGQVREDLRWLARGAKARRTKSKGRIEASFQRMDELAQLRLRNAPARAARIDFSATDRQTQKLLIGRGLSKTLSGRKLFENLDVLLTPGSTLGLMGPNGAGKSTLIRILMGELESDPPTPAMLKDDAADAALLPHGTPPLGTIKRAPNLRMVLFSQHRTEFDPASTLHECLSPVDSVIYRGQTLHIATWAQMFLFTKDQLTSPIRWLSGGEQARIHIARLMLEPADVLILDEPTNDLDLASLDVLEESLEEFPGAVVLVTHDRAMLDRLATQVLALDGQAGGGGARYFADYPQWERLHKHFSAPEQLNTPSPSPPAPHPAPSPASSPASSPTPAAPASGRKQRLSYKQQQELAGIEPAIEQTEALLRTLETRMLEPAVVADHRTLAQTARDLAAAQERLTALYARWQELENAGG